MIEFSSSNTHTRARAGSHLARNFNSVRELNFQALDALADWLAGELAGARNGAQISPKFNNKLL